MTPEQIDICNSFVHVSRPDMVINAGAGSGKTTTMIQLGDALMRNYPGATAFYVTLNKKNADEVTTKFKDAYGGYNVVSSTMHSLAYRSMVKVYPFISDKLNATFKSHDVMAERFVSGTFCYTSAFSDDVVELSKKKAYQLARDMVGNFCKSADFEITLKHTPFLSGYSFDDALGNFLLPIAKSLWLDIISPDGESKFTHDHYLKMFQLSRPVIGKPGDVILYDEAQDAKPAIADIVMSQDRMQKVFCGDTFQAIYGFTGAVDSLRKFSHMDGVLNLDLSLSFRFGSSVAESANCVLNYASCEHMSISGNPAIDSTVLAYGGKDFGAVDAIITRSNADLIDVIIGLIDDGVKFSAVVDVRNIIDICNDIELMKNAKKPRKIAELKELVTFANLTDVLERERTENTTLLENSSMYRVVLKQGSALVRDSISSSVSEEKADVVVSTVHKAKGREWDSVCVYWPDLSRFPRRTIGQQTNRYGDFFTSGRMAEVMLLYVAVTRAKNLVMLPQELVRRVGIRVDNADVWEQQWVSKDLFNYVTSETEIVPRRNGDFVAVPDYFDKVYSLCKNNSMYGFTECDIMSALATISSSVANKCDVFDNVVISDLDF